MWGGCSFGCLSPFVCGLFGASLFVSWLRAGQVNLGRYQAPLHVAQRTLVDWTTKGYLFGAACLSMGLGLTADKKPAPKPDAAASSSSCAAQGSGEDPAAPQESSMKMLAAQPWNASSANGLHRAAQMFSSLECYYLQRCVVRALMPTSEFHSRLFVAIGVAVPKCLLRPLCTCVLGVARWPAGGGMVVLHPPSCSLFFS